MDLGLLSGLGPTGAETQGEHELPVAGSEVDFSSKGNIAVFRARIFPLHLEMLGQILPAVGGAHESHRSFLPRSRRCKTERDAMVRGEEHRVTLVVADPSGISISAVREMRRKHGVKVVIRELPLCRFKADLLENHAAIWIRQNFLVDAIPSTVVGVDQFIGGYSCLDGVVLKGAVTLLLGEEIQAVGNNESHVASTGLVDAGKINFVEDSMTEREPDFAVLVERRTGARLGARSPSWRNAGPAGRAASGRVRHEILLLGL